MLSPLSYDYLRGAYDKCFNKYKRGNKNEYKQ